MTCIAAGVWNLVETTNFDEYMKAVGVGYLKRKLGSAARPTQEITVDGDSWRIKTITTIKTVDISFKLNEEFDEQTADGRNVKTTSTFEDNKLVMSQKGDPDSEISRQFSDKEMFMSLTAKGITCTRNRPSTGVGDNSSDMRCRYDARGEPPWSGGPREVYVPTCDMSQLDQPERLVQAL